MTIKLHVFPPSPRAFKVLFAAHLIGVEYELVPVDFAAGSLRTAEYTAKNPNQRMPTLEDGDFALWESNAIVQYLAALKPEAGYLPADPQARATALKWQFWESSHWDPACAIFMFERVVKPLFGRGEADPAELARAETLMARLGPVLDGQLRQTRYLVGDRMSVADISLASTLCSAGPAQMPIGGYAGVRRWRDEIAALPAWKATLALQRPPA